MGRDRVPKTREGPGGAYPDLTLGGVGRGDVVGRWVERLFHEGHLRPTPQRELEVEPTPADVTETEPLRPLKHQPRELGHRGFDPVVLLPLPRKSGVLDFSLSRLSVGCDMG